MNEKEKPRELYQLYTPEEVDQIMRSLLKGKGGLLLGIYKLLAEDRQRAEKLMASIEAIEAYKRNCGRDFGKCGQK